MIRADSSGLVRPVSMARSSGWSGDGSKSASTSRRRTTSTSFSCAWRESFATRSSRANDAAVSRTKTVRPPWPAMIPRAASAAASKRARGLGPDHAELLV